MGGITALLLVAVGGMTYGWKPDERGGVEYIIQIPPDQLDEIRRSGSISSVIDPAVRGHVSRVVVQIGDGPLPRELPPTLAQMGTASGDRANVPVPELNDSIDLTKIASARMGSNRNQSVMKPQTGDGLSLPPSLDPAAAGNGLDPNTRNVIPPPSTRSPNLSTIPSFTGGNGSTTGMATTRLGGPSTDPMTARDRNWTMPGQGVPSTDPVTGSGATFPPASNLLNPGDTFGQTPSGVTGNPSLGAVGNSGASMAMPPGNFGAPNASVPNTSVANTSSTLPNASMSAGRGNPTNPQYPYGQPNTGQPNTGQLNTGQLNMGQGTFANGSPTTEPNPFRTRGTPPSNTTNQNASSNRPLTREEIAAGAFSVNVWGEAIDREGYPVNVPGTPSQTQANGAAMAGSANDTSRWNQMTNQRGPAGPIYGNSGRRNPTTNTGGLQTQSAQYANAGRPSTDVIANTSNQPTFGGGRDPGYGNRSQSNQTRTNPDFGASRGSTGTTPVGNPVVNAGLTDPPSLNSPSARESASRKIRTQGTQPMVTWLLLISFVSNVYLVFWMKKLLVRYRDLVAAKRVSDSRATA
ncbi:MAG: hypothetical protein AAGI63_07870 [Planctomycetota bacterium]